MKKQVELHEVESIANANPKEYFEEYHNRHWNKKYKCIPKDFCRINFEAFASGIKSLNEYKTANKKPQKMPQKQFQTKNGVVRITSISKF